jgi:cytoskeletal protein CcmA (bactofilin family)
MFKRENRRFLDGKAIDPTDAATTIVGEGSVFVGDFVANGDAVIGGEIRGTVETAGRLHLKPTGTVYGSLTAGDAKVEGTVEGPIEVSGKLEIGVTARVLGDVRAGRLAIAEGSLVQGNLHTSSPPRRFVEGRGAAAEQEEQVEEAATV